MTYNICIFIINHSFIIVWSLNQIFIQVLVFWVIHSSILFSQDVHTQWTCTVTCYHCWTIIIPSALIQAISAHLLLNDWKFNVSGQIIDLKISIIIDCWEQTWIMRMPSYIIDIILRGLKCSHCLFSIWVP